jgi:hypothetical protein
MAALFAVLAGAVVLLHVAFVAFVLAGALLAIRWRWIPWAHIPAAAWAAFVEVSGRICPLTPLENAFRSRAGLDPYSGDFVAEYVFPVLYPDGLTRNAQIVFGLVVVLVNAAAYVWLRFRMRPGQPGEVEGRKTKTPAVFHGGRSE